MNNALKEFENALFGGHDAGDIFAHDSGDGEGPCATMYLMDAEYDPVRITFDMDGAVIINADGNKWVMLTPSQLRFIASRCEAGIAFDRKLLDDEEQNETKT